MATMQKEKATKAKDSFLRMLSKLSSRDGFVQHPISHNYIHHAYVQRFSSKTSYEEAVKLLGDKKEFTDVEPHLQKEYLAEFQSKMKTYVCDGGFRDEFR